MGEISLKLVVRIQAGFSLILFVLGLIILVGASRPRKPLLDRSDWEVSGRDVHFLGGTIDKYLISDDILKSPDLLLWSTQGAGKPNEIHLRSKIFKTPVYLSFPYAEGSQLNHDSIVLLCLESNIKIPLVSDHTNAAWTERTVRIPVDRCGSRAQLIFDSNGEYFTGFGTPFSANIFHYLKYSIFTAGFYFQLAFLFFLSQLFLSYFLSKSLLPKWISLTSGSILMFGIHSLLLFYLYSEKKELGISFSLISMMASLTLLLKERFRRSFVKRNYRWLCHLYSFGLFFSLLLWLKNSGNLTWLPSTRFYPAEWSSDNLLPVFSMKAFLNLENLNGLFGSWFISDRPPLFTGGVLGAALIWEGARQLGIGDCGIPPIFAYGTLLNLLWLFPFVVWRRHFGLRRSECQLAILALMSTGFVIFNSIYTWPKLMTVAFAFPSFVLIRQIRFSEIVQKGVLVTSIVCGVLSLLTHGGAVFYFIALTLLCLFHLKMIVKGMRSVLLGLFVGFLTYLPWLIWQNNVIKPRGALVKFALAGTFGWESSLTTWEVVSSAYSKLSITEWIDKKMLGILNWIGYFQEINYQVLFQDNSVFGIVRKIQQTSIIPSLGPFLIVLVLGWFVQHIPVRRHKLITLFLGMGIVSQLVNLLITWSHHVNGHNSYPGIFLLHFGLIAIFLKSFPRIYLWVAIVVSSVPWILAPAFDKSHFPFVGTLMLGFQASVIFSSFMVQNLGSEGKPESLH